MNSIYIHMLPTLLETHHLTRGTAVVIDVLRASTTIIHALDAGAEAVVPCLSVEDVQSTAEQYAKDSRLLGGERRGELIPGFDLDNSPLKYSSDRVQGKTVLFTTTNGTRALLQCQSVDRVFVGAFVNQSAVVAALKKWGGEAHLVCAGTDGKLTAEDILFAGAVACDLLQEPENHWQSASLQTQMAVDFYRARSRDSDTFRETFFASQGAQNLEALGMIADIERSMERDLFDCVPVWNAETGKITLQAG